MLMYSEHDWLASQKGWPIFPPLAVEEYLFFYTLPTLPVIFFGEKNLSISFTHRWQHSETLDHVTNGVPGRISQRAFFLAAQYNLKVFSFIFLYTFKVCKNENIKAVGNFKREFKPGYAILFKPKSKDLDLGVSIRSFSL